MAALLGHHYVQHPSAGDTVDAAALAARVGGAMDWVAKRRRREGGAAAAGTPSDGRGA